MVVAAKYNCKQGMVDMAVVESSCMVAPGSYVQVVACNLDCSVLAAEVYIFVVMMEVVVRMVLTVMMGVCMALVVRVYFFLR